MGNDRDFEVAIQHVPVRLPAEYAWRDCMAARVVDDNEFVVRLLGYAIVEQAVLGGLDMVGGGRDLVRWRSWTEYGGKMELIDCDGAPAQEAGCSIELALLASGEVLSIHPYTSQRQLEEVTFLPPEVGQPVAAAAVGSANAGY